MADATVIDRVTATTFHHFMGNGRTSPAIFSCEKDGETREYVVKLRGGMELGERGLLCELYASLLAGYFGLSCPRPAIVTIDEDLGRAVLDRFDPESKQARVLRGSIGLNFGTRFLVNLSIWPVDRPVPSIMRAPAMRIFAFDALIQNPDRKFNNPNLGSRDEDLVVFDHELAFSFLLSLPNLTPWVLTNERYLEQHVFARVLKGEPFPEDFLSRLGHFSQETASILSNQVPEEWKSDELKKIETHLTLMSEHAAEFAEEVTRRLA
jgi:hypothetical protein